MSDVIKRTLLDFLRDTEGHTMTVVLDDGLHRHLLFSENGSSVYHFRLITWPGYLCICGDMGTYVFQRTADMFEFFTPDYLKDRPINPQYWAEKIEAGDYEEWSEEKFVHGVKQEVLMWCDINADVDEFNFDMIVNPNADEYLENGEEDPYDYLRELWTAVKDEVLEYSYNEAEAYTKLLEFRFESEGHKPFYFQDFEYHCKEFTHSYIWCLYALVWGINKFNDYKTVEQLKKEEK